MPEPLFRRGRLPWRVARGLFLAAIAAFVIVVAVRAMGQAFDQEDFPDALLAKAELMPVIFPLHMLTGALALLLVPLVVVLRRRPDRHRIAGRITAAVVLVAGVTAFPVALVAPVTVWSAVGFTVQGATWLAFLGLGLWNIRRGRIAAHRMFMLLMAATTSGAIFFRIFLASWIVLAQGKHFAVFYACDAWIAWLLPLLVMFAVIRRPGIVRAGESD